MQRPRDLRPPEKTMGSTHGELPRFNMSKRNTERETMGGEAVPMYMPVAGNAPMVYQPVADNNVPPLYQQVARNPPPPVYQLPPEPPPPQQDPAIQLHLMKAMTELEEVQDKQYELKLSFNTYKHEVDQINRNNEMIRKRKLKREMEVKVAGIRGQKLREEEKARRREKKEKEKEERKVKKMKMKSVKRAKESGYHSSSSSSCNNESKVHHNTKPTVIMENRLSELLEHQEKTMLSLAEDLSGNKVKQLEEQNYELVKRLNDLELGLKNQYMMPMIMHPPPAFGAAPQQTFGPQFGGQFNPIQGSPYNSPPKGVFMGDFQERYLAK